MFFQCKSFMAKRMKIASKNPFQFSLHIRVKSANSIFYFDPVTSGPNGILKSVVTPFRTPATYTMNFGLTETPQRPPIVVYKPGHLLVFNALVRHHIKSKTSEQGASDRASSGVADALSTLVSSGIHGNIMYPNGRSQKSCHVVWNSCGFNENKSNTAAFVNKFPGISQCAHKVGFTRILETMRTLFPEHYSFYPQTWYLPHQMVDFVIHCKNKEAESQNESYYIVKPDAGSQGEGIYLIRKPHEYKTSGRNHVVQEYLSGPLLLDGYKFDLRIYVVLLSLDPLKVYISTEGLARFCTHKYFVPTNTNHGNTFMHLTNYSLNKKSNQFIHTQNFDSGSKRTMSSVFADLEMRGCDVATIWRKLEELVYKTVLAMVPQLKVHYVTEVSGKTEDGGLKDDVIMLENRPKCFQILGFDVLIMEDLQPMLLEVNSNPSLRLDCEMEIAPGIYEYYLSRVDISIKRPLVKDTLKLLEKDISEKFNIEIRSEKDSDWRQRAKENIPISNENSTLQTSVDITEKENFEDLVTEWSTDSEFGPFFTEIAKQNKTLPRGFEISRCNSPSEMTESNIEPLKSPQIRREQINRKRERFAREKSWLSLPEAGENENQIPQSASAVSRTKSAKSRRGQDPEVSCLRLISSESYKSIFEKLRILEATTVIFFHAMGHKFSENMGATAFRTFGRRCKLYLLGFNHAMIDLIYIEVQRRWSFLTNYDSKQGLCYQAFLEALFRIAFAKFGSLSKREAIQALIEHCKVSMGQEHFHWAKALYPSKEASTKEWSEPTKKLQPVTIHREKMSIHPFSPISTKSSSSDNSDYLSPKRPPLPSKTKYDLLKAIHQLYRRKLRIPQSSTLKEVPYSDSDSVKSLPSIKSIRSKKSPSERSLPVAQIRGTPKIDQAMNTFKTYRYEIPVTSTIRREKVLNTVDKKVYSQTEPIQSTKVKSAAARVVTAGKELRKKSDARMNMSMMSGRSNSNQWLSMTDERMQKIISAYSSKNLLKTSLEGVSRRKSKT